MQVNQQKTHFMYLAAEMFAGQAVGELVGRRDQQDDGPNHRNGGPPVESRNVLDELLPVKHDRAAGQENERRRKDDKIGREAKTDLADQPIEKAVRIADFEPQV